jgi:Na+-transporting NADH:ubiquinone oxidoreductase subunit C
VAKNKDSIQYIFTVAFAVCLVCAVIVATAAVALRPLQVKNKEIDFKRNILSAAGWLTEGKSVEELFTQIETRLVDIEAGTFSTEFDIDSFDPVKAPSDSSITKELAAQDDPAGIKRRESNTEVSIVRDSSGNLDTIILPVRGYGLWSTLWGFIALEEDLNTVVGLGFYSHTETPGLGGEVDNPKWKAQWPGKKAYNQDQPVIALKKGSVDPSNNFEADHLVDGLSGATLTSKGVTNLVQYWLGDDGFKPFLENLKAGGA